MPTIKLLVLCLASLFFINVSSVQANDPEWLSVVPKHFKKTTRTNLAERRYLLFKHFMSKSLRSKGKKDFLKVSKKMKNNIFWKGRRKKNIYLDAYHRSYPSIKRMKIRADIPEIVLLIPYLESLWHPKRGDPAADYGYWQLVLSIVEEIQALDTSPEVIKKASPDTIRSSAKLSTTVALLHLRRYYFYFAHVEYYTETDAWLLAMVSYNWGAGNVRRMLAKMERKGIESNFSNFYHYLYTQQQQNKKDRSLKAAVEYLPSLWNIAKIIH
ncbi:MAG: transglycosylase SLT domain-containing protein [Cocleimonas sp.]|nr:transglycosylase SLT domain-containing protein [Cocleimonas sp.]